MYKVDLKYLRKPVIYILPFLLCGLFFLILFFMVYIEPIVMKKGLDSELIANSHEIICNENSEGETFCYPVFYYEIDGNEYKCASSMRSSNVYNVNI